MNNPTIAAVEYARRGRYAAITSPIEAMVRESRREPATIGNTRSQLSAMYPERSSSAMPLPRKRRTCGPRVSTSIALVSAASFASR